MKKFVKNKKIFFFVFLGIFLIVFPVLALESSGLELKWPPSPGPEHIILTVSTPLPKLVQYFYEWGIALGGLAVFIVFIYAGFQYLTSVGDPNAMKEAMERIRSALLGLVLLLGSWLVLNTINPELTTLHLPDTKLGEAGQLECNCLKDDVCPDCPDPKENYQCTGDEKPNDNKKEGVCMKKKDDPIVCKTAEVEYKGGKGWINVGEIQHWSDPTSVKASTTINGAEASCCDDNNARKKGYYGCACSLQVFAGAWYGDWACGDMQAIVPGCEKNIADYVDEPIRCVKLIKSPY